MPYNVPLLRKVREQIIEHPETHNQRTWYTEVTLDPPDTSALEDRDTCDTPYVGQSRPQAQCGTTACVAGWAVQLSGLSPVQTISMTFSDGYTVSEGALVLDGDGKPQNIGRMAFKLLGLHSGALFSSNLSREQVLDMLADYIEIGEAQERADAEVVA